MTVPCGVDFRDSDSPYRSDNFNRNAFNIDFKSAQLAELAENVSSSYVNLTNSLVGKVDQYALLATQMTPLIAVMKQYGKPLTDPTQIFARDQAINVILQTINVSINLLNGDLDYEAYIGLYSLFKTAIDAYFSFAFLGR